MKSETFGVFGNHPDQDIDAELEAEALCNIISDWHMGHSGFGREDDYDALPRRLAKLLDYNTLNPDILAAKCAVRAHVRSLGYSLGVKHYEGAPVVLRLQEKQQ